MPNATTIIFTGKNQVEVISEPVKTPGPGQILIEAKRSLISTGTEGIVLTRNFAPGTHWDNWVKYPFNPGYLHVGKVAAVGADVKGWKVGDRAASRMIHSSHILAGASHALHIPDNVSDDEATFMGLAKIVQVGARAGQHKLGDQVVLIGMGLLGQLAVQYVHMTGASKIIAIDTAPKRLEMAKAHGATHTLQMTVADALGPVTEITRGQRADVVYDITGHPSVFAAALALPRDYGRLVLLGDAGSPNLQTLTPHVINNGINIVGCHDRHAPDPMHNNEEKYPSPYAPWTSHRMHELILDYMSRGLLRTKDLITHRFKPDQAPEAYAMLQTPQRDTAMGVVFEWA